MSEKENFSVSILLIKYLFLHFTSLTTRRLCFSLTVKSESKDLVLCFDECLRSLCVRLPMGYSHCNVHPQSLCTTSHVFLARRLSRHAHGQERRRNDGCRGGVQAAGREKTSGPNTEGAGGETTAGGGEVSTTELFNFH